MAFQEACSSPYCLEGAWNSSVVACGGQPGGPPFASSLVLSESLKQARISYIKLGTVWSVFHPGSYLHCHHPSSQSKKLRPKGVLLSITKARRWESLDLDLGSRASGLIFIITVLYTTTQKTGRKNCLLFSCFHAQSQSEDGVTFLLGSLLTLLPDRTNPSLHLLELCVEDHVCAWVTSVGAESGPHMLQSPYS